MKIRHRIGRIRLEKDIPAPAAMFITDHAGSYFSTGFGSRYSGLFCFLDGTMFRIADSIAVRSSASPTAMEYRILPEGRSIIEAYEDKEVSYSFIEGSDVLMCESSVKSSFDLDLDVRESYDTRRWGKYYEIYPKDGATVIRFTKYKDAREDDSDGEKEFTAYLAIVGKGLKTREVDRWISREYPYDRMRGSFPDSLYVYRALEIEAERFCISAAMDEETALSRSRDALESAKQSHSGKAKLQYSIPSDKELSAAYDEAVESLKSLTIGLHDGEDPQSQHSDEMKGIFAGFPWFFQFWGRDESISLKALMIIGEMDFARSVLFRLVKSLQDDGRLPDRFPLSMLASADAVGWMFFRASELMKLSEDDAASSSFIKGLLKSRIESSIEGLLKNHTKDGFAYNQPLETWMDTGWKGDDRSGMRIEIQALTLSMYRIAYELTGQDEFRELENDLKKRVRERFWNDNWLSDGIDDWTVRPNIFIAAYVYPDLLDKAEWKLCIDYCLERLWLPWGGISTIDRSNPLFTPSYTGENNQSYHRGDSWYWLNCLAAVVMHRVDSEHFRTYIDRIIGSAKEDILYSGFIGHCSEVSSASERTSDGCLCQAWSAAMFIELLDEVYDISR